MTQPIAANGQQQPPAAVAAEQQGILDERDVLIIQCKNRHNEKGHVIGTLIGLVSLIAGVWAGVMVGGAAGFFLACAIILIGGNALGSMYNGIRNHDYFDAVNALVTPGFKQFIQRNNLVLSLDSIVEVHKKYKDYTAAQARHLVPARA